MADETKYIHTTYNTGYIIENVDGQLVKRKLTETESKFYDSALKRSFKETKE